MLWIGECTGFYGRTNSFNFISRQRGWHPLSSIYLPFVSGLILYSFILLCSLKPKLMKSWYFILSSHFQYCKALLVASDSVLAFISTLRADQIGKRQSGCCQNLKQLRDIDPQIAISCEEWLGCFSKENNDYKSLCLLKLTLSVGVLTL